MSDGQAAFGVFFIWFYSGIYILSEARTQYICGVIDEQGLQDAWDDWANKGGNDLIAEVNEAYAADQETAEADENTEAATEEAATEEAATEEASSQAE